MQKQCLFSLLLAALILLSASCSKKVTSQSSSSGDDSKGKTAALPQCIIYKTNADFSHNVPVIMDGQKTRITSYPDPKDVYVDGKPMYPTALADGFWLDNRGIGPDVAFLDFTYEDYHKLDQAPPMAELMKHIVEKNPLTEMYQCGPRSQYKDLVNELNKMIISKNLNSFKKIN